MLNRLVFSVVGACLLALVAGCGRPADRAPRRRAADISLVADTLSVHGRVPRNATLDTLLREQQMRQEIIPKIIELTGQVFDPRRLQVDHPFRLVRTVDGFLRRFEYEIDKDRFLRIAPADGRSEELTAQLVPFDKQRTSATVSGEINRSASSLFAAMEVAGERPELSLALADIFGGEIDFHSDIQPGDAFSLTVEKVFRDGQFSEYGPVDAAEFRNEGRVLRAFRYTVPGGKPGYYDEHGRSLRRLFLASPLKFILAPRVSSRFSNARFHPVLRIYRPHLGVDYRAPIGAPVVAVAAGTVVSAGWSGQAGRLVHLRHPSGYETLYMHLSAINVRAGQRIAQGEVIGKVGSSGLSTGPHLDYRVRKNGRALNPQTLLRTIPPGEPIPAAHLAEFRAARDRVLASLGAGATARAASRGAVPALPSGQQ